MKQQHPLRGLIFDYGGTIDTNSRHWAEVLWEQYECVGVPTGKPAFREAYVFGERSLARYPFVRPTHDFYEVLFLKTRLQMEYLAEQRLFLREVEPAERWQLAERVARACYEGVVETLKVTRPVVEQLSRQYKLVLVSNFYGNIETILSDFGLAAFFSEIVESSVVGVRKPDPAIYRLGVEAMGLPAGEVLVVGDSFSKDMVPAKAVGCRAVWLEGEGWGNETIDRSLPDGIITSLAQLPEWIDRNA